MLVSFVSLQKGHIKQRFTASQETSFKENIPGSNRVKGDLVFLFGQNA